MVVVGSVLLLLVVAGLVLCVVVVGRDRFSEVTGTWMAEGADTKLLSDRCQPGSSRRCCRCCGQWLVLSSRHKYPPNDLLSNLSCVVDDG